MEKITINVSSYKRIESLEKTIASIYNQCDYINVALNDNHENIPSFLYDTKINLFLTDNSLGDAFKFLGLENCEDGYFLTIDDDLVYPSDYVQYMISKSKEYGDSKVITLHGRNFGNFPIGSYYRSAKERYSCLNTVKHDVKVQFGGTGVMCFNTNLFRIPINYFKYPNMADVWIGKYCIQNNIEIICAKHSEGYIKYLYQKETIFDTHSKRDELQTRVVNSIYDPNLEFTTVTTPITEPTQNVHEHVAKNRTLELTRKSIDYDKVNQLLSSNISRSPNTNSIRPNTTTKLKTNSQVLMKLSQKKKR